MGEIEFGGNVRFGEARTAHSRREAAADAQAPADVAAFAVPRLGTPEEVTALVLQPASEDGGFATGAEFVLDGGPLLGLALAA